MTGMTLATAKGQFFDRQRIENARDRGIMQRFSRFGAFVRTRARSSIRSRKRISAPGEPPSSHSGQLKNGIFFAYDSVEKAVVIGPVLYGRGQAPRLLERGGSGTVLDRRRGRQIPATYRARPFMRPAFEAELTKMPGMLAGSITKG